jgi:hypothetical protein
MRSFILACAALTITVSTLAQPVIDGLGYVSQIPFPVAPGQVITLFVQGVNTELTAPVRAFGNPWPPMLGGVSVTYRQGLPASDRPAPILEVRPISTVSARPQAAEQHSLSQPNCLSKC